MGQGSLSCSGIDAVEVTSQRSQLAVESHRGLDGSGRLFVTANHQGSRGGRERVEPVDRSGSALKERLIRSPTFGREAQRASACKALQFRGAAHDAGHHTQGSHSDQSDTQNVVQHPLLTP